MDPGSDFCCCSKCGLRKNNSDTDPDERNRIRNTDFNTYVLFILDVLFQKQL